LTTYPVIYNKIF